MGRVEQITAVAQELGREEDWLDKALTKLLRDGFMAGARWADANPAWVSVEERLPDVTQLVLAKRETFDDVDIYKFMGYNESTKTYDWEWHPRYIAVVDDITHWMPLPTPPKKGGNQ